MPNRTIGAALLFAGACASVSTTDGRRMIKLFDGQPVSSVTLSDRIVIEFDGSSDLRIKDGNHELKIDPKTPAILTAPEDGSLVLLNFGNGSGQVYSLEAYALDEDRRIDISEFIDKVYAFAKRHPTCSIDRSQISFVFSGWLRGRKARVQTEDFSRSKGCEAVNRDWVLAL